MVRDFCSFSSVRHIPQTQNNDFINMYILKNVFHICVTECECIHTHVYQVEIKQKAYGKWLITLFIVLIFLFLKVIIIYSQEFYKNASTSCEKKKMSLLKRYHLKSYDIPRYGFTVDAVMSD